MGDGLDERGRRWTVAPLGPMTTRNAVPNRASIGYLIPTREAVMAAERLGYHSR
ncbi:MAG: hypothetical protein ACFCVK_19960 [Acidimicrobiales bacterium]